MALASIFSTSKILPGKEIKRSKVTVNAGQNNIELNRDQFGAAGNYVVKIELDKKIISSRVTIIN